MVAAWVLKPVMVNDLPIAGGDSKLLPYAAELRTSLAPAVVHPGMGRAADRDLSGRISRVRRTSSPWGGAVGNRGGREARKGPCLAPDARSRGFDRSATLPFVAAERGSGFTTLVGVTTGCMTIG
jgi:hypothetical protein